MGRFREYTFLTVYGRQGGWMPAVTVEMGADECLGDALKLARMLREGTTIALAVHRVWADDGRTETYRWEIDVAADDVADRAEAAE